MKYFLDEAQRKATGGTCYFEFQKGHFRNTLWLSDSLPPQGQYFTISEENYFTFAVIKKFKNFFG